MRTFLTTTAFLFLATMISFAQHPSVGGYNVYYGHMHNHTGYSDGEKRPEDAYKFARDNGGLDFFGLSDHVEMLSDSEYKRTKTEANRFNEDGRFVTFYGWEWTSVNYGHVSVFNSPDRIGSGLWLFTSFKSLVKQVNRRECIAFFNHPGSYNLLGNEFSHFTTEPSEKFVGMELWNGNKGFSKYYYNNGYYRNDGGKGYFDEALVRGWKIGAAGSEDNHDDDWGTKNDYRMAILSKNLTRAELYAALKARRFFATLDKNLSMSFKMNGSEMGSEITDSGNLKVSVLLNDEDNERFTSVQLLKNGEVIHDWPVNQVAPSLSFTADGVYGDYFYIRCRQADGDEAISSPIFIYGSKKGAPVVAETNNEEVEETVDTIAEEELLINTEEEVEILANDELNFKVYPNPSTSEVVYIQVAGEAKDLQVVVVNANGRVVINDQLTTNTYVLPNMNSGIYFVKVSSKKETKTQTLIIR